MQYINKYNKKYSVTKDGKVWSQISNRFLKQQINYLGYPIITFYGLGKNKQKLKTHYIHRLVAEAYIKNKNNYKEINHKDGNKSNNNVGNLEWCTRKENINHAFKKGLIKPRYNLDHPRTKLSSKIIKEIKLQINNKYGTLTKLAKKYNVSISLISLIKKGYRI